MSRLRQKKIFPKLLFALLAAVVFIASYYLGNQYARPVTKDISATVLAQPEKISDFQLTDDDGEVFTPRSFESFWNFVIVGNLQAPSCDSLLRLYVMAWNNLAHKPALQKKTRVVFVHSGADLKKPEQLKQAIAFFNPAFVAVSGAEEAVQRLAQQLGLHNGKTSCATDSNTVALISPDGYLLALFTGATDPVRIARDLQYFN